MADEMNGSPSSTGTTAGTTTPSNGGNVLHQFESVLHEYLVTKAPFQLPMNVKEIIVKLAPWLTLIFAILALPLVLAALGLTTVFAPFAMMGGYRFGGVGFLSMILSIVVLVLELMALPGLFHRTARGWRLVFYASLISVLSSLVSFDLVGAILGAVIGWYFLFQVQELYHN